MHFTSVQDGLYIPYCTVSHHTTPYHIFFDHVIKEKTAGMITKAIMRFAAVPILQLFSLLSVSEAFIHRRETLFLSIINFL